MTVEAPKRIFVKATFPLSPAEAEDSKELTCLHCGRAGCEFILTIRGQSRVTSLGIHEACVSRYAVEGGVK